jgi:hypothetical protein
MCHDAREFRVFASCEIYKKLLRKRYWKMSKAAIMKIYNTHDTNINIIINIGLIHAINMN